MSIYKGSLLIAGGRQTMPLLSFIWADHQLNDISWLRADTFSWQSGAVYTAVYQHLVDDIDGITAESETVGGITISFYRAPDGHKITTDESAVLSIYNATGVAWYYVLDTVNTRFKLPRTKFGFTGLRTGVGGYVDTGLPDPNITVGTLVRTNTAGIGNDYGTSGNHIVTSTGGTLTTKNYSAVTIGNSIYGNSDTVQPKASQMYLYFYVGQFTQTAIEQTAGINAETLNGKVDKGHQVVEYQEPTSANNYTWYRKYADGWVEQGGVLDLGSDNTSTGIQLNVTLPVIMADTMYYKNIMPGGNAAAGGYLGYCVVNTANSTTTGIEGYWRKTETSIRYFYWEVKGIAA